MSMNRIPFKPLCISVLIPAMLVVSVFWGSRTVTVLNENSPIDSRKTVIIDAGHGGPDGGAVSCTGIYESAINLEIALRLDDLMHLLGIHTVMIRREDASIGTQDGTIAQKKISDLKARVKIVNDLPNAILISIHQNHFTDSRYKGAQVFYAKTENSKSFAAYMQENFVNTINNGSSRKAKATKGVYLMDKIKNDGILIECGFLSNPEEERLLRSELYQKEICQVIATTTSRYLYQQLIT